MQTLARPPSNRTGWITSTATARLHLGFVDLNGGLGRRFGSLGMALEQPALVLALRRSDYPQHRVSGVNVAVAERALRYANTLLKQFGSSAALELRVEQALPEHAGLGSGTQLALAVGAALTRLLGRPAGAAEIAARLGRGARSGIGIGAFAQGGFVVDGGRGNDARPPPLLSRLAIPEQWRVLLVFDDRCSGVHGPAEREAFARLPEFTAAEAGRLCRLLLMQALPALAEADCTSFGAAISEIQRRVGDYFAPLQGGRRFTSPAVAAVLQRLSAAGAAGVGQSSWGPTGFALCADPEHGQRLLAEARRHPTHGLRFLLCQPRNRPALIATA